MTASLIRRVAWRLSRFAGKRATRWAWDDQFQRGRWSYIADERSPLTVELVTRFAGGGRVVELGCAEGGLAALMSPGAFSTFHGIDVSAVAIERARLRHLPNCTFEAMTIEDWSGDQDVDCIVAEEVLYYPTAADRRVVIRRALGSLSDNGVFLAIVHDKDRYAAVMDDVRKAGHVVHEQEDGTRLYIGVSRSDRPSS